MLVPAPLSADPIRHALAVTRGHVGDAAKLLGVSRPTLYDRAKKIGMALADEAAAQKAVMAGEHNTVTLSMQDYLSLRAAALGHQDALTKAESMIDHLTRKYLDLLTQMKACGVSIASSLLLCLLVSVPAFAQLQAPNRRDVVERVAAACPGFILQDHAFTDAVATVLNQEDARWGRNGKRGNPNDPSHDAIAFRNPSSPFGVSVVDIIGAAGSSSASPAWIDQTQATIDARTTGAWVRPSGVLPTCLTGGSTPPPPGPTPPPVVTTPAVDLAPVLTALARLQADVDEIKNRPQPDPAPPDLGLVNEFVDDMIGNGPGDDAPNHITDILQRLDANRAEVLAAIERVFAWLRGRAVLRY